MLVEKEVERRRGQVWALGGQEGFKGEGREGR